MLKHVTKGGCYAIYIDEEDTITFNLEGRYFTVGIIGAYTTGGCDVDVM